MNKRFLPMLGMKGDEMDWCWMIYIGDLFRSLEGFPIFEEVIV